MSKNKLSEKIIEKYGENLYKKSLNFPKNKIKIISLKKKPLKLRCILLDNDREFHLVIDEKNHEIFHDCPIFLFNSERDDKICNHIIRVLSLLEENIAFDFINQLDSYVFTLEDYGSKKKSKNFLKLAYQCLEDNNCVDGLNYLSKAIINTQESESIIKNYLQTAIKNGLYIEFFEFLQTSYENDLDQYLIKFNELIEQGTKKFFKVISYYSFFEILKIIDSIDSFLKQYKFQNTSFLSFLHEELIELVKSNNLNERYFSFFFINKYYAQLLKEEPEIEFLIHSDEFGQFKHDIVQYFLNEIENFCIIEKLKLMKNQFREFGIPEAQYIHSYKKYKEEIKELERKVYLKKFSFLKLFIDKFYIIKTRVGFRKKRNTYVVNHNDENIKNPAYQYIVNHLGFYGLNESTIKSSEIGINYLIIKELFLDDLSNFPDIFYYKKQFWGDSNDYEINPIDFYSIMSKISNYTYDIDQNYSNINDLILIEWDLANKPRQGSLVNAFGAQIVIPDKNNPLFHDLNPFDLCYCQKIPVKIERNLIKTINVITKCSFKDAIKSVSKGMEYIEGYYPLSLVEFVEKKLMNPFDANEILIQNPDKMFIPNYKDFVKDFQEFLFEFIGKQREYIYHEIKLHPKERINQLIILLNLNTEIAGIDIQLEDLIDTIIPLSLNLHEFRKHLLEKIHNFIENLLKEKNMGSTAIFNLTKMHNTQFSKYSTDILKLRKLEFEQTSIYKVPSDNMVNYDIEQIKKTYYGNQISKILGFGNKTIIRQDLLNKFVKYATNLNLELKIID